MKLPPLFALLAAVGYSAVPGKSEPPKNMMAAIPLHFEPNVGQTDPRVSFTARGSGMSIFVTPDETVLARRGAAPVRMKLRGGKRAKFEPFDKLPGVSNYYRGNDPKKWREGVPHYARVRARNVYEGVDVVYYGNGRRLEYDFVVAPGADASKIELAYEGAESMRIDASGDLVLVTKAGALRQRKPVVYQEVAGRRVDVAAEYRIREASVRFELARYDAARPVVIDPILDYGTFLGGIGDDVPWAIAADASGAIWVAGETKSVDFPVANIADDSVSSADAFVTKINPDGATLGFSTRLGGSAPGDRIHGIALDPLGFAYVAGITDSFDFPLRSAVQSSHGGIVDGFTARMSPSGSLVFSTYLGGSGLDYVTGVTVNGAGVFVACSTESGTFLGNSGTGQRGVVAGLNPGGSALLFARTLTGSRSMNAIATDSAGALYLTGLTMFGVNLPTTAGAVQPSSGGGEDAFAAKLSADGTQWLYVTHLGGSGRDEGNAIVVSSSGQASIAGSTASADFPVRSAFDSTHGQSLVMDDAFLTMLDSTGSGIVFSTYLGGNVYDGSDRATGLALAPDGGIVVAGNSSSPDFPLVAAWRSQAGDFPHIEAFFAKFSPVGGLVYSSFAGKLGDSSAAAVAAGPAGVYLTGRTKAGGSTPPDLVTPGAFDVTAGAGDDVYVARFVDGPAPVAITVTSNPPGRPVFVDGREITTPSVFSWTPGTPHSLEAFSQQVDSQQAYAFISWSQGGAAQQRIVAPSGATAYTANFNLIPCSQTITPGEIAAGFEGFGTDVAVSNLASCQWTATSEVPWISASVTPLSYSGLRLAIAPNTGAPRSGAVTAGTARLTIRQAGRLASLTAPAFTAPLSGQQVTTKSTNLAWTPISVATGYELRVRDGARADGAGRLIYSGSQTETNSTSATVDLPRGLYLASIRGCSGGFGDANCGAFSTVSFAVDPATPSLGVAITSPLPLQVFRSSTNLISWNAVQGATSYAVTLENLSTNRIDLQINTATLGTVFTMRSGWYSLVVRPCQQGCRTDGSPIYFRVQLPTLSGAPPTGLTAQLTNGNTLNLSWNPVLGADLYRVQVVQPNAGPGGGALTVAARQVSTTNASLQVPAGAATVVLNACNGDGCGPPSTIAVNPTGPNPSVPIVATPMPVVVADGPNITISWSRIPGDNGSNTDYRLYVGDLSRDGPALDVITKNNFYGAFLRAEGRRYDALVFATQNGVTVTGPASGFMVAGSSATAPLITSPTHNSTFKQGPFRLAWSPIPDAVRYQYYVGRQGQSGPVLTGVTPGIFVDTTLSVTAPTLHQAIVRACPSANASQCSPDSDAGWGPWSQSVTGTTSFTITP